MTRIQNSSFSKQLLEEIRDFKLPSEVTKKDTTEADSSNNNKQSFLDHLQAGVDEVNLTQKTADTLSAQLASGEQKNLHETMMAVTHADLSFNFMVQVRNKMLESYQEIMRMPV